MSRRQGCGEAGLVARAAESSHRAARASDNYLARGRSPTPGPQAFARSREPFSGTARRYLPGPGRWRSASSQDAPRAASPAPASRTCTPTASPTGEVAAIGAPRQPGAP
jgi:hypothetical protein